MRKRENKIVNLLKLGVLFLGTCFILLNCEKENSSPKEKQFESKLKISYIYTTEIDSNSKLTQKLADFSKPKNTAARDVHSSEHNFTIDTDLAKYIENSDRSIILIHLKL